MIRSYANGWEKQLATKIAFRYRVAIAVGTVMVGAIVAPAVYQRFAQDMTPTQVEKLVARLDPRVECDRFRAKLLAQSEASRLRGQRNMR
ncbi:protein of unknown function (plasmid) [Cupriavidus taiwanensis]|uniref:Transmembrane protein n=1 Tax=Cupriavidus taiwanensis TaxID=164546 RepID=A0A375IUU9_9BURK|nr:protein of unknown function [Cupriavidus taiwanensis]